MGSGMTNLPYIGATPEQLRSPMVRELLGVHNMFRNQLETMLRYIEDLTAGRQQLAEAETKVRIQSVIRAGSQYAHHLHTHHHLETSMMFPALRGEGLEPSIIDRLNAEHDDIAVLIDQFSGAIHNLSTIDPDVLNTDLQRLAAALQAHLAYEETHVCPFLAQLTHWPTY